MAETDVTVEACFDAAGVMLRRLHEADRELPTDQPSPDSTSAGTPMHAVELHHAGVDLAQLRLDTARYGDGLLTAGREVVRAWLSGL